MKMYIFGAFVSSIWKGTNDSKDHQQKAKHTKAQVNARRLTQFVQVLHWLDFRFQIENLIAWYVNRTQRLLKNDKDPIIIWLATAVIGINKSAV